ncbi:MAG: hypothetical protein AB7J28_01475 [Hyphomonadaceae bacterium]
MQTRTFGVALIGGGLLTLIANAVFLPMLPAEAPFAALAGTQVFLWRLSLAAAGLIFVLFGMIGLYIRQAQKPGWFGASTFPLAFVGAGMMMAHEWAQVFFIHHTARTAPGALDAIENVAGPNLFDAEAVIAVSAFTLGWILWCASLLVGRAFSWPGPGLVLLGLLGAPALAAAASALGFDASAGMAAGAVLLSLGWIALGRALLKPA